MHGREEKEEKGEKKDSDTAGVKTILFQIRWKLWRCKQKGKEKRRDQIRLLIQGRERKEVGGEGAASLFCRQEKGIFSLSLSFSAAREEKQEEKERTHLVFSLPFLLPPYLSPPPPLLLMKGERKGKGGAPPSFFFSFQKEERREKKEGETIPLPFFSF